MSLAGLGCAGNGWAATVRVPSQFAGIQAAINVAQNSDTVLISRGTYAGNLVISGKSLTLASLYIVTGDTNDIALTTISGGSTILTIDASAGPSTTIRGLTFLDGGYQIENYARRVNILDVHFIGGGTDQMSFEGAGGVVRGCRFEGAGDDAIDVDNASDPVIENNRFQPEEIRVKANSPFVLVITNKDKAPEEFESHDLRIEKVIPAGKTIRVKVNGLKPGTYGFEGEYHAKTAKGRIVAE